MSEWMPSIDTYMAVAKVIHDETEQCEEHVPFADCVAREADIQESFRVLRALRRDGWQVTRDPAGTVEMGL
jgi:hypothetical protein